MSSIKCYMLTIQCPNIWKLNIFSVEFGAQKADLLGSTPLCYDIALGVTISPAPPGLAERLEPAKRQLLSSARIEYTWVFCLLIFFSFRNFCDFIQWKCKKVLQDNLMGNREKKKRKHILLSITEKVELLQKLDRGVSVHGDWLRNMASE